MNKYYIFGLLFGFMLLLLGVVIQQTYVFNGRMLDIIDHGEIIAEQQEQLMNLNSRLGRVEQFLNKVVENTNKPNESDEDGE